MGGSNRVVFFYGSKVDRGAEFLREAKTLGFQTSYKSRANHVSSGTSINKSFDRDFLTLVKLEGHNLSGTVSDHSRRESGAEDRWCSLFLHRRASIGEGKRTEYTDT